MNARKIIVDCDPGIDDALALMLLLRSPEVEILGITVVCGNVPTAVGAENALKILSWMDRPDIPVYTGEESPLTRSYVDARDTHGSDGLGETFYPSVTSVRPHRDAVQFLADTLAKAKETEEKITILALGPLTNIARLIERRPDCLDAIDGFYSMGGCYRSHGNCSPVAEYNYWCDPHAAKAVFDAFASLPQLSGRQIQMIGLDVTRKIVLTPNLIEYLCRLNPEIGEKVRRITRFYVDFHWEQEGIIGCVINDPLAAAYLIDHSLCTGFSAHTEVETEGICLGQSVVDAFGFWGAPENSYILTRTSPLRFMEMFFERLTGIAAEKLSPALRQLMAPDSADMEGSL